MGCGGSKDAAVAGKAVSYRRILTRKTDDSKSQEFSTTFDKIEGKQDGEKMANDVDEKTEKPPVIVVDGGDDVKSVEKGEVVEVEEEIEKEKEGCVVEEEVVKEGGGGEDLSEKEGEQMLKKQNQRWVLKKENHWFRDESIDYRMLQ
ncbi:hypothetical protein J5N97_008946 [Dioscorea zingiberensis]|uniref:Uncharacterized protein n=1 Tax=Dioscorea zingiberensis TaxID=325984 RepID=A0A9D5CVY3_9LILI|nr:hypothetical protein J5N97_008946 [Dioscorea zingiberensis]